MAGRGVEETDESIVLLLTFKAFKLNVSTVTAYKGLKLMCRFRLSATNHRYQLIS